MAKTKGGLTFKEESDLLERLDSGSEEALEEARQLSAQLAKRANVRLKAMEDANLTSIEYRRAKYYTREELGKEKFSESKKLSADEVRDQLQAVNRFLNAEKQTTVGAIREEKWKKTQSGLEKAGIIQSNTPSGKRRELRKFLSSDAFKEIKSAFTGTEGGTGGYLSAAADAIENGAKMADLERMYNDYKEKLDDGEDISIFDIMDDWIIIGDE